MKIAFNGANVLISGGSRGIGLATAIGFADLGANVAFTYERTEPAAQEAMKRLEKMGIQARAIKGSVTDETIWSSAVREIVRDWGSLDVVVANAGIWKERIIDELSIEEYRETMEINMTGTFLAAKYAARQMKLQRSGSIVIVSSTAGQRGESEHSHYAASKGAAISFTKSLAVELAPWNIRVNCVAPGWVQTDMTKEVLADPGTMARLQREIPLGRPGKPDEIANAILFVASEAASFITGEILNVNGGSVLCG